MEADKAVGIGASALFLCMCKLSEGRCMSCTHISMVHETENPDGTKETWLITFSTETNEYSIDPIAPGKYPDGALIYWHDNKGDAVTQAALNGDNVESI